MTDMPFEAILFDCDGVLVDSEPLVNQVLVEMMGELGWQLSLDEAIRIFTGKMVKDQAALILQRTGVAIDAGWERDFRARRDQRLLAGVTAIPGASAAVAAIHATMTGRMAVASGADLPKVGMQLHRTGLDGFFGKHVYSGQDLPANKPHPDVYLHAAAQLGARPGRCAVIEDSATGVRAGAAAGATVFGYVPARSLHSTPEALRQAGASLIFHDMGDLPGLLRTAT